MLTLKECTEIFVKEDAGKKILNKAGFKNITVVNLGINEKNFLFDRKYANGNRRINLLSVGYLVPRKRMGDLIDAMNILVNKRKIKNISLTLVGEGTEKNNLLSKTKLYKLESYIKFAGFVSRQKIHFYYKSADIFLSGSIMDSMTGIYFEAMASSLPVVLAENNSSKALQRNNLGGFVVKGESPIAFANAIEKLVLNRKLRERFGHINYELFKKHYSLRSNIRLLINVLKN